MMDNMHKEALKKAKASLNSAIERHERHMKGTEATNEASQQKLMDEMEMAEEALESIKPSTKGSMESGARGMKPHER